ncbi:hypothetical protein CVT26_007265 [Gymnopilus dilepis]|uniref:Uncharacterized protein n=1 Tax=Gymnopilus dilepis TaxID=231916 RepID=A0A409VM43_9AGAR|nr:hypothetical protein CVT26_007265 [Gymnopilus dilepis]
MFPTTARPANVIHSPLNPHFLAFKQGREVTQTFSPKSDRVRSSTVGVATALDCLRNATTMGHIRCPTKPRTSKLVDDTEFDVNPPISFASTV